MKILLPSRNRKIKVEFFNQMGGRWGGVSLIYNLQTFLIQIKIAVI